MKRKTAFARMEEKIDKSKILKAVNEKLGLVDKFIDKHFPEAPMEMDIRHHTVKKKWTPMERKVFRIPK